jgi:uncharacterized protein (TIGR00369 family)
MTSPQSPPALPVRDWGDERTRSIHWHDPLRTAALGGTLSGLALLEAIRDGMLPPPPMAAVFGFRILSLEPGRVVFCCEPDESTYNPIGTVHGGLACTLADTVTGCAVQSVLEPGSSYTTIDIAVSFLRPVTLASGMLRATGVVTRSGRRVAFATAEVQDADGRLVATATSSLLINSPLGRAQEEEPVSRP